MADYPKASKELQEQQQSTLDLIAVQLQIANAQTGPTKDEFQKANTELLREMLEGNETQEKLVEAIEDGNDTETESINSQKGWWTKLLDHFSWERGWIEAQEKKALRAASKVKDFGKQQVDMLKSAAKGLFDLLLTGLGLLALAALFKWLSEQDWEKIYEDTVAFATEMLAEFDSFMDTLAEVGGFFLRMTGMFWAYYLFSKFESWDEATKALGLFLDKFSFKNLFGENSKIRQILRSLKTMFFGATIINAADDIEVKKGLWGTLFGPDSRIRKMLRSLNSMFSWRLFGAADDVEVKKGLWTTLFGPDSRIRKLLRTITNLFSFSTVRKIEDATGEAKDMWAFLFGPSSPIRRLLRFITRTFGPAGRIGSLMNIATGGGYGLMFGENGAMQKLLGWVKGFFGGEGKLLTAFNSVANNPKIVKVVNFLKTIGAKMLKFLGPVSWLIAGYDAIAGEGGFMSTFEKTEGSLWEKTVAGLSAAVQSLVDFFVFDTVQLIEDFVKWSIKKLAGLFGIEEKDVEGADWYKFSITDFLRDFFGDIMLYLEGIYTLDPKKMAEGIKGMWGKFKGLVDWAFGTLVTPLIQWVAKNVFGFSDEEAEKLDFKPMQWLEDNFLTPLFNWLEGLFSMDFEAMAKSIMPDWLYSLFADEGSEKAKKELRSLGLMTDNLVQDDTMNLDQIGQMLASKEGVDQKNLVGQLSTLISDESIEERDRAKLKALLNEYGAGLNRGGYVPPGMTVPAVLHGPEVVKPLKEIPAQERPTQQMAPTMISAPSTSVVNSSSPTSIVGSVSSQNPQKKALGY